MLKKIKLNRGFTLVELLLYIALVSFVILSLSVFFSMILSSRVKNQTIAEVEQQGARTMQTIVQSVRNAESINSPAQGANASSLSLHSLTGSIDPTVFDLSGGTIRIKEGSGLEINLTSPRIIASGLDFYNLSRDDSPGAIRITFTLTLSNPGGQNDYDFTKTFYGTANIRTKK